MSTTIPIGPFHPLLEEPEYITLQVEGETVVGADMDLGRIHRGMELLAEEKTFDQDVFLVERICGICSASHSWAATLAMEDIGGIVVPDRARYLRTIVHELERLHSHMLWVGLAGHIIDGLRWAALRPKGMTRAAVGASEEIHERGRYRGSCGGWHEECETALNHQAAAAFQSY